MVNSNSFQASSCLTLSGVRGKSHSTSKGSQARLNSKSLRASSCLTLSGVRGKSQFPKGSQAKLNSKSLQMLSGISFLKKNITLMFLCFTMSWHCHDAMEDVQPLTMKEILNYATEGETVPVLYDTGYYKGSVGTRQIWHAKRKRGDKIFIHIDPETQMMNQCTIIALYPPWKGPKSCFECQFDSKKTPWRNGSMDKYETAGDCLMQFQTGPLATSGINNPGICTEYFESRKAPNRKFYGVKVCSENLYRQKKVKKRFNETMGQGFYEQLNFPCELPPQLTKTEKKTNPKKSEQGNKSESHLDADDAGGLLSSLFGDR